MPPVHWGRRAKGQAPLPRQRGPRSGNRSRVHAKEGGTARSRAEGPRSGAHRVPPSPEVPKEPPRFRGQRAQSSTVGPGSLPGRPSALPPLGFLRRARQDGEGGRPCGRDGQRAVGQAAPGRRSPRPCPSGRSVPWRRRKAQLAGLGCSRLLRPPQEVPGGWPR